MNSNAIVFTLQAKNKTAMHYYAMAYYALETLQPFYDESFDVILYHDVVDFDIENDVYNEKYNIVKDFPWVKFIHSEYKQKYNIPAQYRRGDLHDAYMAKWYHLQETFKLGYDKLFMLDVDVVFYRNPAYLFSEYTYPTSQQGDDETIRMILGRSGWSSAHVMIQKDFIGGLHNFYDRVAMQRQLICNNSAQLLRQNKITQKEHDNFCFFSEQYAGQMAIETQHRFSSFELTDIYWEVPVIDYIDDEFVLGNPSSSILHYSTAGSGRIIPKRLRDDNIEGLKDWNREQWENPEYELSLH